MDENVSKWVNLPTVDGEISVVTENGKVQLLAFALEVHDFTLSLLAAVIALSETLWKALYFAFFA